MNTGSRFGHGVEQLIKLIVRHISRAEYGNGFTQRLDLDASEHRHRFKFGDLLRIMQSPTEPSDNPTHAERDDGERDRQPP